MEAMKSETDRLISNYDKRVTTINEIARMTMEMTSADCFEIGCAIRRKVLVTTKDLSDAADWIDRLHLAIERVQVVLLYGDETTSERREVIGVLEELRQVLKVRLSH